MYILFPPQGLCRLTVKAEKGGEERMHGMPPYYTSTVSIDHVDWQGEGWGEGRKKTPGECPQHLPHNAPMLYPKLYQGGWQCRGWGEEGGKKAHGQHPHFSLSISRAAPLVCLCQREMYMYTCLYSPDSFFKDTVSWRICHHDGCKIFAVLLDLMK